MQEIKLEIEDHVALATLNKPEKHNAYTLRMSKELSDVMNLCEADDDVRAIVITGAGESFCVGMDLSDLSNKISAPSEEKVVFEPRTYPFEISKPVICAINGRAGGFGIAYPLACDIRIVDEDATLAFSFVRNGMIPEMGASWLLPRMIGIERASELLLTGRKIKGRDAVNMGLVAHALPKAEVLDAAMEMADDIAQNASPVAVALTKRLMWDRLQSDETMSQAVVNDRDYFMGVVMASDGKEGAEAFLQKRKPNWTGSVSQELSQIYRTQDAEG